MTKPQPARGRRVGYIRRNGLCADLEHQLEGVKLDLVFTDEIHRKKQFLSQFARMMAHLREGDTLVVERIDRLGRSPAEFLSTVRTLTKRGVRVEFIVEGLFFPAGEESPLRNLLLLTMAAFHESSQSWVRERHREASAKELSGAKTAPRNG